MLSELMERFEFHPIINAVGYATRVSGSCPHPEIIAAMEGRFAARGWKMPAVNRRQAQVPEGATVLANPNGTAPGLWLAHDGAVIALLPGPPREMKPMMAGEVRSPADEALEAFRSGGAAALSAHLRIAG